MTTIIHVVVVEEEEEEDRSGKVKQAHQKGNEKAIPGSESKAKQAPVDFFLYTTSGNTCVAFS